MEKPRVAGAFPATILRMRTPLELAEALGALLCEHYQQLADSGTISEDLAQRTNRLLDEIERLKRSQKFEAPRRLPLAENART